MTETTYDVSFFSPRSASARENMKMVIIMLAIWAVAVFGFQFLLIGMNKLTPEPTHGVFTKVWPAVTAGTATAQDKKDLARSILMVLGKNIAVKDNHKKVLKNVLGAANFGLGASGNDYKATASLIGLGNEGFDPLLISILKSSMVTVTSEAISPEDKAALPGIMDLYLKHNRSALTDTRFLGFPFHYWYTSQFLLILFVSLCWVFCYMTDAANTRHNLETEGSEENQSEPQESSPAEKSEEEKES